MSKKVLYAVILAGLVLALALPLGWPGPDTGPRTRVIELKAKRYGYSPARIIVNQGDKVVLKPTSLDVTHGFLLDHYGIEAILKQQGLTYLKYTWKDETGKIQSDWDKVKQIEFVADRPGKFTFRCTQTCGNLHPFMTGELIVRPNRPYHLALSLSLWLTASLLLWFFYGPNRPRPSWRLDISARLPWLGRLLKARSLQFWFLFINLAFFYLFILSALWGSPVGNRNIAIIFVWIFWWTALKAVLLPLGGRIWCFMCPLPAPGEWLARRRLSAVRYQERPYRGLHHRFTGLNRDWPRRLKNGWLQNFLFLALISFGIILITRPVATAGLFLLILGATLVLSLLFRGRVFCRFLCPVGGFLGTYAMAAVSEVRVRDRQVCKGHREKNCLQGGPGGWACPWGQYPGRMERNNYCGLCTECFKSCPKDNLGLFLRPFGGDLRLKGWDEVFNVLIMLAVAFVFSVTMLGPWNTIKAAANLSEARDPLGFGLYLGAVWSLTLVVLPGCFLLAAAWGRRLAGGGVPFRDVAFSLAYVFIPLGIFTWIAFSLPQVMINYTYILSALSDPLGLGWDLLGTAKQTFRPFWPQAIPYIQGLLLLAGLYLGISRGWRSLDGLIPDQRRRARALLPVAGLCWLVVTLFLALYLG